MTFTRQKSFKWITRVCFALLAFACVSSPAFAQVQSSFTGTVTDPTGAVVPDATVTVLNLGTDHTDTTKTDARGIYRVGDLSVGQYKITISATGFKTVVRTGLSLNAGVVARVDVQLQLGAQAETVTVEASASQVITDDIKLYESVGQGQVANLPLNGRNVFDLMQLAPGALNATGVSFENGHSTVVNGMRPNFSGFLINGVSNKGLSGGVSTTPNADIVEEFQELTLNMSAQYGTSAGAVINVVTKSGTNTLHGTAYEFLRNDVLDANDFFRNQVGAAKPALRFNQFGVTATGPIIKDKLFFSGSYQGERFTTAALPTPVQSEAPEWRAAIIGAPATANSVAALLYKDFPTKNAGIPNLDLTGYVTGGFSGSGFSTFAQFLCRDNYPTGNTAPNTFAALFGVLASDAADFATAVPDANGNFTQPCSAAGTPGLVAGQISRTVPFINDNVLDFGSQTEGNLFNGNEFSGRVDYLRKQDRFFGEFYWQKSTDKFGPANVNSGIHGFGNPQEIFSPNFQASWVHTFSPNWINEARVGYQRNRNDITTAVPGVPAIGFDDATAGFGSYNGYPQLFRENVYSYSEMMSFNKGKHVIKTGVDFRRNLENSDFSVSRPSYYFFDQLFFAAGQSYGQAGGVDPGFASGLTPQLASNLRYWRNLEMGAFIQDDWKARPNLTISIGMRYDLFGRHKEKDGKITTFIPGPGGITPANQGFLEWISNANVPAGSPGCTTPQQIAQVVLAGVCGPGGFAIATALGGSDHNNFGPRVGFAWDPFSNGKTSVRGGFGVSYEGTLYNPLSNSRWNPPFYSFNLTTNALGGGAINPLTGAPDQVVFGPTTCLAVAPFTCSPSGATPTYTGAPTNPGMGTGAQATGNLSGYASTNSNTAFLTGVVYPEGIKDPYIFNYYFGVQREVLPKLVLEVTYVGTQGHKLFRAEQTNRAPGINLPGPGAGLDGVFGTADDVPAVTVVAQGRTLTGLGRRFLNPNYGRLRTWENVSKSWYNALQVSVRRQMSHGLMFTANYSWSHSIDTGSGWHSGSVTANGAAAGDGYSLDQTRPGLDRGNSTFDIRHRLVLNYVWEFPWYKSQQGFIGHVLGGWQYNGIWSFQSGAHWTPFCATGNACDFNFDGERNDIPDVANGKNINASRKMWADGFFPNSSFGCAWAASGVCANLQPSFFATPCVACNGNLGRNTMVGPGQFNTDQSIFKNIKITERFTAQFRVEMFNAFNHANFRLPSAASGGNGANRITAGNFGQSNGTLGPRNIQFGLKILW